jgi:hypothetical protein
MSNATKQATKVTMVFDKETKSTFRFRATDDTAPVTVLYVDKGEFPADVVGATLKIEVTVTTV